MIVLFTLVFVSIAGFTGYASHKINDFFDTTSTSSGDLENETPNSKLKDEPFAMLLLGVDYRPETGSMNTDAIIVSVVHPKTNKVTLLSIPRDTLVYIPGYGQGKVNGVYSKGEREKQEQIDDGLTPTTSGEKLLMEVLSDYLDIPINYYAKVDFKGFELIIDELGGLEIDVERDMVYYSKADGTDINLQQGLQTLSGEEALDYARFRKSSDGNDSNDFERNERHQNLIKAFIDEAASFKGVTKVFEILDITGDHTETNLTSEDMKALLWKYKGINNEDIQSIHMESYWESPYVIVDEDELLRVQGELQDAYDGIIKIEEVETTTETSDSN